MSNLTLVKTTLGIINNQNSNVVRLITEAHQLGIKIGVYSESSSSMLQNADFVITGKLTDKTKLKQFASRCQWVIYLSGDGISDNLINDLKQNTRVPEGTKLLDVINDRSIQRVFLKSLNVNLRTSELVFSLSDVEQAAKKLGYPLALQPVQTNYFQTHEILITKSSDLDRFKNVFNGESYILESLPQSAKYFDVTALKSKRETVTLPAVEKHYQDSNLSFASVDSQLSPDISDRFTELTKKISNQLDYVGSLSVSFILTNDNRVYVDGVDLPFSWTGNVFNLTADNEYQMLLRSLMNTNVKPVKLNQTWLIKPVSRHNLLQAQQLWMKNKSIALNVSPLVKSNYRQPGYALVSSSSIQKAGSKLSDDQL